jgi:hypothetical protein
MEVDSVLQYAVKTVLRKKNKALRLSGENNTK